MRTPLFALALALALALSAFAVAPAVAAPYALDRLHDRENRIQDRVDQRRLGRGAGPALTRVRELEQRMRAGHGSNLTRRDFAILNARLHAIEHPATARRAKTRRPGAASPSSMTSASGARRPPAAPAPVVTTTTTTTTRSR